MKYDNLRNKTVFDFCNDVRILAKVTGFSEPMKNKEYIKGCTPIVHSQMLQALAEETNNDELKKAATKLEDELWAEIDKDNEAADGPITEP